MAQTKYRGVPVPMSGRVYIVPSLTVEDFRKHVHVLSQPIAALSSEELLQQVESRIEVIGDALRRNYPDVTNEQLGNMLDLDTLPMCVLAVQNASGLEKKQEDDQGND